MAYPMICPATFPTISQIAALVCETRWIVGDVPPSALQDERGGREEAAHFTAAHVAHRQRRLGDPLANFEDAPALEAFIFVGRHPVEATWGGLIVSRRHGLWLILSALVLVAGCSNAKEAEKRARSRSFRRGPRTIEPSATSTTSSRRGRSLPFRRRSTSTRPLRSTAIRSVWFFWSSDAPTWRSSISRRRSSSIPCTPTPTSTWERRWRSLAAGTRRW